MWDDFIGGTSAYLMSQSRITRKPKPSRPIVGWHIALGIATILLMAVAVYLAANWIHSFPSTFETATG